HENRGKFDGVILSLPNFGDETGGVEALKDAGVPIFIQAYPDELVKMGPAQRRDSFCGKLSMMDVFRQYGVKFTIQKPHVVSPSSEKFQENIRHFDGVCSVVKAVRGMNVGAIGARTTPFKTVRIDELALQRHGISVETVDMSDVFDRMRAVDGSSGRYKDEAEILRKTAAWDGVPEGAFDNITKLAVVLRDISAEMSLDAMSIRCWIELQAQMGISPCVVNGILMETGFPVACEVDTGSAVMMRILGAASNSPTAILDWNNNYEEEDDKCVLFHCGNAPESMMAAKGRITDHEILANSVGHGKGFGCNQGRMAPGYFSYGNLTTEDGRVKTYLGNGEFVDDPLPENYFGVAGVAEIPQLQDVLQHIGFEGHRHHVALTPGDVRAAVSEALSRYLDFDVTTY
ncbi:MAG: hypothetical protein HN368_17745, partial [Spirochaetales bacterium]|nr:hypothetical protein [Spirochaetales bacterium]